MPDQKRPYPEIVSIQPSYSSSAEFDLEDKNASEKSSPQQSISPQSLHTKPWPARPQTLHKGLEGWRWWDSTVDFVMVMLPVPFIILIVAVIVVNGREVDDYELNILDHAIKGVSLPFPPLESCLLPRPQPFSQSSLQLLLAVLL
jgi:hypothetical protein